MNRDQLSYCYKYYCDGDGVWLRRCGLSYFLPGNDGSFACRRRGVLRSVLPQAGALSIGAITHRAWPQSADIHSGWQLGLVSRSSCVVN